MGILP
jgi:hypothetical protein